MSESRYIYTQEKLFEAIIYIVWASYFFYTIFYIVSEVWLRAAVLGIGTCVIAPLFWLLNKKGHKSAAALLITVSATFYTFWGHIGFSLMGSLEYYYLVIAVGAFLMFDLEHKKSLILSVALPLATWASTSIIDPNQIPESLLIEGANLEIVAFTSKVGSTILVLVIMAIFVFRVKELKDLLVSEYEISQRNYKQLLRSEEYAKIGSWRLTFSDQQLYWSEETYRIYELEPPFIPDVESGINYFHPDDRERITNYVQVLIDDQIPYDDEFKFVTAKGNHRWVRAIGFPLKGKSGEVTGIEGCFQDITEKKEVEMAKEEFLALVSHEMRTPLMSVIGFSDILRESKLEPHQEQMVNAIYSGGEAVVSIINDVLDVSKIKNSMLRLRNEACDLEKLLKESHVFLSHSAKVKGLDFNLELDIQNKIVLCDPTRLRQVITNFLSNAIKFTDEGFVSLEVKEVSGSYRFCVHDSGCGMSKSFIPKIFDAFEQDGSAQSGSKGTGLGMYISKSLIDMMEGDIEVQSEPGVGSAFCFTLPLISSNICDYKTVVHEKFDFDGATILYADDTPMNQMVVKKFLESANCKAILVDDGQKAVDVCLAEDVDIVLMDLQMPVLDGFGATESILAQKPDLPIIAFSAFSNESSKEKAYAFGCIDILSKPIRKNELLEKIHLQLEKAKVKTA